MARKLTPATPGTDIQVVDKTPPEMAAVEIAARAGGALASDDQQALWRNVSVLAGRIQAAMVIGNVSSRIIAESYSKAVESGAYVGMPYVGADGSAKHVSSLDEFCNVFFGKGARRCQQIAANLDALGPELFDSAEKIGFGQRDYAALKALPDDEQEVIKQALAEGGDRESVIGMLTALVERQAAEKAAMAKDLAKATTARDKAVATAASRGAEIQKLQLTLPQREPDETVRDMMRELAGRARDVQANTAALLDGVQAITQHADENELECDEDVGAYVLNALRPMIGLIADLRNLRGIDGPARFALEILARPGVED